MEILESLAHLFSAGFLGYLTRVVYAQRKNPEICEKGSKVSKQLRGILFAVSLCLYFFAAWTIVEAKGFVSMISVILAFANASLLMQVAVNNMFCLEDKKVLAALFGFQALFSVVVAIAVFFLGSRHPDQTDLQRQIQQAQMAATLAPLGDPGLFD